MLLALLAVVASALFATASPAPQAVPAVFDGQAIVGADINGHRLWFLLDTGANGMFVDRSAARAAGMTMRADGTAQADVALGSVRATDAAFGVLDLPGYDAGGVHVSGYIGTPFFESGVVSIDFANRRVLFYPPGAFDRTAAGAPPTPILFDGHVTRVHAWFGATRATMLLDTGAQMTVLYQPFAAGVILGAPLSAPAPVTLGIGVMPTAQQWYHAKALSFGGVRVMQPVVDVADRAPANLPATAFDGILGRDVLSLFRMTLDYRHEVAYFVYDAR